MRLSLLGLITGFALSTTPAVAQIAPAPVTASGPPLLSISVTESVKGIPDIATISAGVQAKAPTASDAMAKNAAAMHNLIDAIKSAGIAPADMQTSAINLNAEYVFEQKAPDGSTAPPKFIGYQASNTLTVRSRDIGGLGPLLDRLVKAGATNINGPSLSIAQRAPLADQARLKAMATGKARAELYARSAGYNRVRLISMSEEQSGGYGSDAIGGVVNFVTRIEPGEISTSVSVNLTYVMEN